MVKHVPAGVLIALGCLGLLLLVVGPAGTTAWQEVGRTLAFENVSDRATLDGTVTGAVDSAVEEHHPLRRGASVLVGILRYSLFRQGSPGVVVGREGWLFTREEFETYPTDDRLREARVSWIAEAAHVLRDRGVELAVVLVPAKAEVAASYLPWIRSDRTPAGNRRRTHTALEAAGVAVVDPISRLESGDFFRTDTHWKPRGADKAAQMVAAVARDLGEPLLEVLNSGSFALRDLPAVGHDGDLLAFLPLGPLQSTLGFDPERYIPVTVEGGGEQSLFGPPTIPVTLVGTSYSADERWGFSAALSTALQADVLVVAQEGSGPFVPMAEYLQSETFRESPPQLLVWEIPVRYMTLPSVELPAA